MKDKEKQTEAKQPESKKTVAKAPEKKSREFKTGTPFIKAVKKGGVKVEFTSSPTGLFGLAYNAGEIAPFDKKQAEILISAGVAKKA